MYLVLKAIPKLWKVGSSAASIANLGVESHGYNFKVNNYTILSSKLTAKLTNF